MKAYVGQTRSTRGIMKRLDDANVGECTVRGELPPARFVRGWFYDNGAFRDWKAGALFQAVRFQRDMRMIRDGNLDGDLGEGKWRATKKHDYPAPDFIVVPDKVAAGLQSLEWSSMWRDDLPEGVPAYLAVQDGIERVHVEEYLHEARALGTPYAGLFVGGTLNWKLDTARDWVSYAHLRGMQCHVGRVGTAERVRMMHVHGVDSIDSCLPLRSEGQLEAFLSALAWCGGSR